MVLLYKKSSKEQAELTIYSLYYKSRDPPWKQCRPKRLLRLVAGYFSSTWPEFRQASYLVGQITEEMFDHQMGININPLLE